MRKITMFCLLTVTVSVCNAQWVQTNGPSGANVYALALSGACLFAKTGDHDVFRSTDNGSTWTAVDLALLQGAYVRGLAAGGAKVFLGANLGSYGDSGVSLCSTDNGTSWNTVSGLPCFTSFCCSGMNLFAVGLVGGVFRSTDNGTSWTKVNSALQGENALVSTGANLFAGTYDTGVLLSTNSGTSWTPVNEGLPRRDSNQTAGYEYVQCLASSGQNLYAGMYGHGVFLSSDNGTSWSAVNSGLPGLGLSGVRDIRALAVSGTNLFAGTWGGVYLSKDNGTSWARVTPQVPPALYVSDFAVSGTGLFAGACNSYWGGGVGVWFSSDNGATWTAANSGLTGARVTCLTVSDTKLFAGTLFAGVSVSTNNGGTWTQIGLTTQEVSSIAVSGTNLFAGTTGWFGDAGVFLYAGTGKGWTAVNEGLPRSNSDTAQYARVNCLASRGQNLFAGTVGGVFVSTNNGTSWTPVNSGLTEMDIWSLTVSGTNLFAGTWAGGVFRSTNDGMSWTAASSGLPPMARVRALAVDGASLFAGTDSGVFRSADNGTSWKAANSGLPADGTASSFAVSGSGIFVGTGALYGRGVFYSTNHGTVWTPVNEGLRMYPNTSFVPIRCLAVSGPNLFAGTEYVSVWRRPLSQMITSVGPVTSDLPCEFSLQQNYPNPFNPETKIEYGVSKIENVKLTVHDMLGREVSVLVNERKAPGSYEVKFDGFGLSSGVYFYRLEAGNFVEVKKLLLLR